MDFPCYNFELCLYTYWASLIRIYYNFVFGEENCYHDNTKNKTTTNIVTVVSTFPETLRAVFFRLKLNHFPRGKCLKDHSDLVLLLLRSCWLSLSFLLFALLPSAPESLNYYFSVLDVSIWIFAWRSCKRSQFFHFVLSILQC